MRLSGSIPALPPLETGPSVARQCGTTVPDRSLVAAPDGALQYAVVSVEDAGGAGAPGVQPPAVVDQRRCAYEPPVLAARAGALLALVNSDPLMHNVRASAGATLFNVAMPITGQRLNQKLPAKPGLVSLHCDVHPWMRAAVKTFDHPFFAVTDEKGHYAISGLPAGKHEVVFWHGRFPERRLTVDVPAGGTAHQDAEWPAAELQGR